MTRAIDRGSKLEISVAAILPAINRVQHFGQRDAEARLRRGKCHLELCSGGFSVGNDVVLGAQKFSIVGAPRSMTIVWSSGGIVAARCRNRPARSLPTSTKRCCRRSSVSSGRKEPALASYHSSFRRSCCSTSNSYEGCRLSSFGSIIDNRKNTLLERLAGPTVRHCNLQRNEKSGWPWPANMAAKNSCRPSVRSKSPRCNLENPKRPRSHGTVTVRCVHRSQREAPGTLQLSD